MLCEKCQRDTPAASPYIFYYGNQTGKVRRGRQTITTYSIGGSQQPTLCNECVFTFAMKQRANGFIGAAVFFFIVAAVAAIVAVVSPDLNNGLVFWLAAALLLGYTLSLFFTSFVERKRSANHDFETLVKSRRDTIGSELAISLRKPDMQARGFKQFFTPSRMKQLKLSAPAKPR